MEMFAYDFMQRAFIESLIVGSVCAVIGVYVVLNGLSFIGAGISHASFGGIALGFLLGIPPVFSAVVFCSGTALAIGYVGERSRLNNDATVGIFFAATMALGVMLLSFIDDMYIDIYSYLFGDILAITTADITYSLVLAAAVFLVVGLFYKEFLALSFDYEMAAAMGIPVRILYKVLLVLIALTIVTSIKAIGIVLVAALLVTPAATAYQFAGRFKTMIVLSVIVAVASSFAGLILSFYADIPSGATIVLIATLFFLVAWLLSPRRRKLRNFRRMPA